MVSVCRPSLPPRGRKGPQRPAWFGLVRACASLLSYSEEITEVPDLKNGATKQTEKTKNTIIGFLRYHRYLRCSVFENRYLRTLSVALPRPEAYSCRSAVTGL